MFDVIKHQFFRQLSVVVDTALPHEIKKLLQIPAVFFDGARFDCATGSVDAQFSAPKKLTFCVFPKQIANLPCPFEILGLHRWCSADFFVLIEITVS